MYSVKLELADELLLEFDMGYTTSRSEYDSEIIEDEGEEHVFILSTTQTETEFARVNTPNSRFNSVTVSDETKYDYDYITDGYDYELSVISAAGLNYTAIAFSYIPDLDQYGDDRTFYSVQNAKPNTDLFCVIVGPEY